jgi:hypothetical protein
MAAFYTISQKTGFELLMQDKAFQTLHNGHALGYVYLDVQGRFFQYLQQ